MIRWNMLFIFSENPHGLKNYPRVEKMAAEVSNMGGVASKSTRRGYM